eukprot:gene1772-33188_t
MISSCRLLLCTMLVSLPPKLGPSAQSLICPVKPAAKEVENSPASRSLLAQPSIASGNAFNLHSRPGAALVIYLDFTGTVVDDAWWIESYLGTTGSITCPPYDIDNNPGVFSTTEKDRIIKIWQTVAEDFAPWDVDVTTVDPGIEALRRIDSGDINYGMRVIFGACAEIKNKCGCGGIAYLSTFSANVDRPVFVFNTGASGAAEAASHEVGHALGLSHDGTSSVGYYTGHGSGNNGWAPIMGVGYYQTVVQWSKGEYADANQKQDDIVKISSYIPLRPDDHGSSPATATPLFPSSFGSVSVSTEVSYKASVNAQIQLWDGAGMIVASAPVLSPVQGSTLQASDHTAGTYYISVTGVGFGNPLNTGYSTYGSLGQYWMDVNYVAAGCIINGECESFEDQVSCPQDCLISPPPGTPPGTPPNTPPRTPPGTPPAMPPRTPPGTPPGTPPNTPPGTPPAMPPGNPPNTPPGTPPAMPPGTPPATPPGTPPNTPPGTPPGNPPGDPPGTPPATPPGTPPNTPPGTPPGTPPNTPPGTPPNTPPGTPPATPPGNPPTMPPATPPGSPPSCNFNNICELHETAALCPSDCAVSFCIVNDGVCSTALGENCRNSNDCAGQLRRRKSERFCCGSETPCSDGRCTENGRQCYDTTPYCGDGTCMFGIEDTSSHYCIADCSQIVI